jgi:hypothetical protein
MGGLIDRAEDVPVAARAPPVGAQHRRRPMRVLNASELNAVSGGANPHLTTISITTNPGGVVNKSITSNPNAITTTITYKTTGKPA